MLRVQQYTQCLILSVTNRLEKHTYSSRSGKFIIQEFSFSVPSISFSKPKKLHKSKFKLQVTTPFIAWFWSSSPGTLVYTRLVFNYQRKNVISIFDTELVHVIKTKKYYVSFIPKTTKYLFITIEFYALIQYYH